MDIEVNRFIGFTIIAIIILMLFVYIYKKWCSGCEINPKDIDLFEETTANNANNAKGIGKVNCVCAFDIDYTITCGNPKPFIDKCISHGCKLALNTARPVKYVGDVNLDNIGLTTPHCHEDDFYYNPNSYSQTAENTAEVKSTFLNLLNDKYDINNKKCVVLLDDHRTNIKVAQNNGFETIKAKASKGLDCGLSTFDLDSLDNILQKCN